MSREGANNTTLANLVGQKGAVRGRLFGKVTIFDAFRSAKIGKPFETTKRRPRIVPPYRTSALVRLIIPLRGGIAGSNPAPATNFSDRGALSRLRFSRTATASFTLAYPAMSSEGFTDTTRVIHVGRRTAVLGHLFGKVTSRRFQRRENWKTV
jgi:hypothetical protein